MSRTAPTPPRSDRRRFLALGGCALAALLLPARAGAGALRAGAERTLRFFHLHTGERLEATYWARGHYLERELAGIDRVLRDHRTDEVKPIDRQLLDLLHRLHARLDSRRPFEVISGYRSPATNAMLAARSGGVASRSLHMDGMAIDIRLADRRLEDLRRAALDLQGGGVGYYPRSDFVHVDTGRVRAW
jgi:uncharacterized protein YcbK (DUF882 family)